MKIFVLVVAISLAFTNAAVERKIKKTTFMPEKIQPRIKLDIYSKIEGGGRIISGQAAEIGQFPWQVGVIATGDSVSFLCGGALINNQWVLTAAHCLIGMNSFVLHLGGITLSNAEEGKVRLTATQYIAHPDYNQYYNHDIGLIRMDNTVEFSERIQPVRLPFNGLRVQDGTILTVSGWGKTSDESTTASATLQWTDVTAIANSECSSIYDSNYVVDSTLCTVGNPNNGTCSGDSGGPLVWYDQNGNAIHEGVVSFGVDSACEAGYPSGFVRTSSYLDWIQSSMSSL